MNTLIDIHIHMHPARLFKAVRSWFIEHEQWDFQFKDLTPEAIAAHLHSQNVERFVFCSYAHKPGIARSLNTWVAAASRSLNHYGLALATIHLDDPEYLDDMRQAFKDGCIGLKIHEVVQKIYIDDPRFKPVLDMVAQHGGIVLLHLDHPPGGNHAVPTPQRMARILDQHPDLKLLVAHLGGGNVLDFMEMTADYPNLWLDTTWVFGSDRNPAGALITDDLLERNSHRLIYGTDFPLTPWPYDRELNNLRTRKLSTTALNRIVHDNAADLLKAWVCDYP